MKIVASLSLVSVAAALVGCSATSSNLESSSLANDPSSVGDADSYCDSICAKEHECDSSSDEDTCVNQCKNKIASVVEHVRGDSLNRVVACVNESSCKNVLDGDAEDDCGDEELASLSPSQAAKDFCASWKSAAKKCGQTVDTATCLKAAKIFNDGSLADAESCTEKSCSAQSKCIGAAFGGGAMVTGAKSSDSSSASGPLQNSGSKKDAGAATGGGDEADPTDEGTGSGTCTAITGTTAYDKCMANHCCSEATQLQMNSSIAAYQSCLSSYGSSAVDYCAEQYPGVAYDLEEIRACSTDYCAASSK